MRLNMIKARRVVNQHNIDCFVSGTKSSLCAKYTHCIHLSSDRGICCNRCTLRNHMELNPESVFIGYKPQKGFMDTGTPIREFPYGDE